MNHPLPLVGVVLPKTFKFYASSNVRKTSKNILLALEPSLLLDDARKRKKLGQGALLLEVEIRTHVPGLHLLQLLRSPVQPELGLVRCREPFVGELLDLRLRAFEELAEARADPHVLVRDRLLQGELEGLLLFAAALLADGRAGVRSGLANARARLWRVAGHDEAVPDDLAQLSRLGWLCNRKNTQGPTSVAPKTIRKHGFSKHETRKLNSELRILTVIPRRVLSEEVLR
jgi:hypothetical protein